MKVVYEKAIIERIQAAVAEAKTKGRRIEKIVLTLPELRQLDEELTRPYHSVVVPSTLLAYVLCVETGNPSRIKFPDLKVCDVVIRPEGDE